MHFALRPRDLILMIMINMIWGLNLVTIKYGLNAMPPILFAGLRLTVMLLCLWPWLRWFPGQMRILLTAATLMGAVAFSLVTLGLHSAQHVSTIAIVTQLSVPFTTLLSVVMLGEVIYWRRKLGISMAFLGVLIIGLAPHAFNDGPGMLYVVLSAFCGALALVYVKRLFAVSPLQLQAWMALLGAPCLLLLSGCFEQGQLDLLRHASWSVWGTVLFAALFSSILGHGVMLYLVKQYPVTSVAPLTLLSAVFGMLFGVLFAGDQLSTRMWVGGIITLGGVLIVTLRDRRIVEAAT